MFIDDNSNVMQDKLLIEYRKMKNKIKNMTGLIHK